MKEKIAVRCHNEEEFNEVKMISNPNYWRDVSWTPYMAKSSLCIYLSEITGWDRKKNCIENGRTIITAEEYLKDVKAPKEALVKSLEDIYNERVVGISGSGPIKVLQRIPCGARADAFCLISIDENTDTAFGYYEKRENNLIRRTASKKQWLLWTPPEPVPHWAALKTSFKQNFYVQNTGALYPSEESAKASIGHSFIRLIKEWPPVMITPEED